MVYQLLIGQMGEAELAVMAVIAVILPIGLSLASGLSGAVSIVIGNNLGADELELSEKYSRYALYSSVITGVFCAALLIVLSDAILSIYTGLTPEVVELISICLPLLALKLLLVNVNLTLILGVLRAGGDAKFCMNMDAVCQWGWAIPMVAVSALWLGLPLPYVFFFMLSEEIVKIVPTLYRMYSNRWMNNLTKEPQPIAV